VADRLHASVATKAADGHDLLGFSCWNRAAEEGANWLLEVEEYVQRVAVGSAYRTLTFRDSDGKLRGVTAFDKRAVQLGRVVHSGWHLQVVALAADFRGRLAHSDIEGTKDLMPASEYLFRRTFVEMRAIDPDRQLVTARVHDDNLRSVAAARRVDLLRTERETDDYWLMLGTADPLAGIA
jgi:hypothetical protein